MKLQPSTCQVCYAITITNHCRVCDALRVTIDGETKHYNRRGISLERARGHVSQPNGYVLRASTVEAA